MKPIKPQSLDHTSAYSFPTTRPARRAIIKALLALTFVGGGCADDAGDVEFGYATTNADDRGPAIALEEKRLGVCASLCSALAGCAGTRFDECAIACPADLTWCSMDALDAFTTCISELSCANLWECLDQLSCSTERVPDCGDGTCSDDECAYCPQDCGSCPPPAIEPMPTVE